MKFGAELRPVISNNLTFFSGFVNVHTFITPLFGLFGINGERFCALSDGQIKNLFLRQGEVFWSSTMATLQTV